MYRDLEETLRFLSSVPGLNHRSAVRILGHLLDTQIPQQEHPLVALLQKLTLSLERCADCQTLSSTSPCLLCASAKRCRSQLCIVENSSTLWAMERCRHYQGLYHVLGGMLSATQRITAQTLDIPKLRNRITALHQEYGGTLEVILGIPSSDRTGITIEYLLTELRSIGSFHISQISCGIPYGSRMESLQDDVMRAAFMSRQVA